MGLGRVAFGFGRGVRVTRVGVGEIERVGTTVGVREAVAVAVALGVPADSGEGTGETVAAIGAPSVPEPPAAAGLDSSTRRMPATTPARQGSRTLCMHYFPNRACIKDGAALRG